jgi:hypothetical protein
VRGEIALVACPIGVALIGVAKAPDVAAKPRPMAVNAAIANERMDASLYLRRTECDDLLRGPLGAPDGKGIFRHKCRDSLDLRQHKPAMRRADEMIDE